MDRVINVVAIGGGSGLSMVASTFVYELPKVQLYQQGEIIFTGGTTVTDGGGSSGILRRGFLGDCTKGNCTLSRNPFLREVFMLRFEKGERNPGTLQEIVAMGMNRIAAKQGNIVDCVEEIYQLRRSIPSALCSEEMLDKIFGYEFPFEFLYPHSIKNLVFFAFEDVMSQYGLGLDKVVQAFCYFCDTLPHQIIPVANATAVLKAKTRRGEILIGEDVIDTFGMRKNYHPYLDEILELSIDSRVPPSEAMIRAIRRADIITVGPGSEAGSILAPLAVIREELAKTIHRKPEPEVIWISNIMTSAGEAPAATYHDAEVSLQRIQRAMGRHFTRVICDITKLPREVMESYKGEAKVHARSLREPRNIFFTKAARDAGVKAWLLEREVAAVEEKIVDGVKKKVVIHDKRKLAKVFAEILQIRARASA